MDVSTSFTELDASIRQLRTNREAFESLRREFALAAPGVPPAAPRAVAPTPPAASAAASPLSWAADTTLAARRQYGHHGHGFSSPRPLPQAPEAALAVRELRSPPSLHEASHVLQRVSYLEDAIEALTHSYNEKLGAAAAHAAQRDAAARDLGARLSAEIEASSVARATISQFSVSALTAGSAPAPLARAALAPPAHRRAAPHARRGGCGLPSTHFACPRRAAAPGFVRRLAGGRCSPARRGCAA